MMLRTPAAKRPRIIALDDDPEARTPARSPILDADDGMGALVTYDEPDLELCEPYLDDDSMRCSYKCRNMVKSELIERLDLREKQAAEFEAATRKLKESERENQRLVARVNSLEQSLAAAVAQEQGLHAQRADEIKSSEERFRKQLLRCNETQEKLMTEIRLKSEAETKAEEADTEIASLKNEIKNVNDKSANAIRRLEREIQEMEENNELCLSKLNAEIDACRRQSQCESETLEEMRVQYSEVEEKLNNVMSEKMDLERELAAARSKISTTRITESQEAETVIKSLRKELDHQSAEILEARKLKASHLKQEGLEAQLESYRKRLEKAEDELSSYADMKCRVSALESDLNSWEEMLKSLPGILSRDDIPEKIFSLQRGVLVGLSENGDLKAKVEELQIALAKAVSEKQEALSVSASARQDVNDAQLKISRLERQIVSLTKERDGVKSILKSYDEEETFLLHHQKENCSAPVLATPEKSKQKRIEELESLLASSQEMIKVLEKELEESSETSKEHQKSVGKLLFELDAAHSKANSLERESLQLRQEIGVLEGKVACGEFDPSKTKVLKLRTSLDSQEMPQTKTVGPSCGTSTNEQILCMLENKEKIAMLTKKVGTLEQEISTLKKRENRYMQVFAEKAFTFRTACGLIFGYEILMNEKPDSAVTYFQLRSVYSRDKEYETLEFQYAANGQSVGRIDMVANDYTTSPEIDRQVKTFLQGFKSIPAFTANLTLELFNKGTIG